MKPGLYQFSAKDYHADDLGCEAPMLSSSVATVLLRESPKHAWACHPKLGGYVEEPREMFDLGEAAHSLILEGTEQHYAIIDAADWRTKAAKEARDAARAAGKTPLLIGQVERVRAMSAAVRAQLAEFADKPAPLTNGAPEQTLVWQENEYCWCKARIDWLHQDRLIIDDLKTGAGSAHPDAWQRAVYGRGGDVQPGFYLRGLRQLFGIAQGETARMFRWVVVENKYPYAVSLCTPSYEAMLMADQKVQIAIDTWTECLRSDYWPAYPRRACTINPPVWEQIKWETELEPF